MNGAVLSNREYDPHICRLLSLCVYTTHCNALNGGEVPIYIYIPLALWLLFRRVSVENDAKGGNRCTPRSPLYIIHSKLAPLTRESISLSERLKRIFDASAIYYIIYLYVAETAVPCFIYSIRVTLCETLIVYIYTICSFETAGCISLTSFFTSVFEFRAYTMVCICVYLLNGWDEGRCFVIMICLLSARGIRR